MSTIVCIGDSIVEGEGDEKGLSGWVGRLQQTILQGKGVGEARVYNLGIGMETSVDLKHRFFSEVLYRKPDIIILQGAHGDSRLKANGTGKEEFEVGKSARLRAYHQIFSYLELSQIKVLILGLNPVSKETNTKEYVSQRMEHIESHNRELEMLCKEYNFPFLDPRDIFQTHTLEQLYVDGLHPNAAGYELMFTAIQEKLINLKYLP